MSAGTALTLAVGTTAEPWVVGPITRTHIVRYAGASGDFNVVHHDDEFARSAGYPSVFSIGMLQAGILGAYAAGWLGAENVRRFGVRFKEQVWPGDVLTCTGSVAAITTGEDGVRRVTVALECARQTGGMAITGSADFVLD